ncbi:MULTISPECIES: FAD-binding oxidoreductase [Microbacterium]|uniref:FAD-binding oxidoreductase n=1 Tax=Microbacterium wangchenii TaxID=2541726 RepID=A0ABX5SVT3_9MICO|nr:MULTISPECIES: FAD-binding oxidoreductase [Microbacterium]MCK6067720.1 FAD-binding oxidoreductase [Microbacterium sp. EYE_512]QBR89367.1 FAD-binding oxidoreductase [Microbacterium wangchenii]
MNTTELSARVSGALVRPGDPDWDRARLFHSGIGEPDLIVRAADVEDVRAGVAYAAAHNLPVGVRGGGHSAWGSVPGGVLIDLAALRDIRADAATGRVSVGGGATWGEVARALAGEGLGLSSGDTASVGVAGLTLGGGVGWMVRAWGLAADQLVGAQVVTASGEVVEASATEHPDLFWALRGGGGNVGVVTRFDFLAHPLRDIVFAVLRISGDAGATLRVLRDLMRDAARGFTVTYMDVPAMDPNAPAGATITLCGIDTDVAATRAFLEPVLAVPGVVAEEIEVRAYPDVLMEMPGYDPDQPPPGFIGGNTLLPELGDDVIDALVTFRATRPAAVVLLRSLGGAYGDVPAGDTPFPARSATWFAMAGAFDVPGLLDAEGVAAAEREWAGIEAHGLARYANFSVSTDPEWARRMYPEPVWSRLAAIKRTWDPGNLFRRNHNVPPAIADGTS